MDLAHSRIVIVLGAVVASLAGIASLVGIVLRGDLGTVPFVTVRGEAVSVVSDGIYRYNAESIVAEGVGWDIVTLLLVVPVTYVTLALLWRGSLRAALVMGGLFAYFSYQYFEYTMFWAYGAAYPLHLLTGSLGLVALSILIWGIDRAGLPARVGPGFPRRAVVGFAVLAMAILCGLWLPRIMTTLGGQTTDELQGATTMVVPAFDLGLLVPLALFTAVTVARRMAVGYVLAVILLVKGVCMALAIDAMLLVEWLVQGELQLPPVLVFAFVALVAFAIGARAIRAIDEGVPAPNPGRAALEAGSS